MMKSLFLSGLVGLLLTGATTLSAATIPFRGGEILAAELSTTAPKIEHLDRFDFDFQFENKCYALVTVKLSTGRNLSTYDYSLELFGRSYPCVAVRTGDGGFDADRWEIRDIAPGTRMGMLFIIDGNAVGKGATEKIELKCNAPGTYPPVTLPFSNLRTRAFTAATRIPATGAFPEK